MVWGALGLDKSDVTFSIGVALAMFLFTRRAFAREPFGHAQLGRLILATIGILIGFVLLGLALDAIFGTARLPAVLPRIILNAVAQLLGSSSRRVYRTNHATLGYMSAGGGSCNGHTSDRARCDVRPSPG